MHITKVEAFLMSYPMPEPVVLPFWGGVRTILKRDAMLIKVHTDSGLTGYAPGPAHERAAVEIKNIIGPFLTGKDPRKWKSFKFKGNLDIFKTYHAVEVALTDLASKYEGCPMSELLGGRKRSDIKLYGSAGMYMSPEAYAEEAAAISDMGFPGYKMRPAAGPEDDLKTVELMRKAVGPRTAIMIDAHTWWRMGDKSYSPETIKSLAREFSVYNPEWLEEPLPPEDHNAYHDLKSEGLIKLASGEHEQELGGFKSLIDKDAVDFLQMDVCCQGGFEMGSKIFEMTQKAGLKFAFHSWGNELEVLAAAQLGVCWSEDVVEWLEYPCYSAKGRAGMYPFPLSDEILEHKPDILNGYLQVPDGPGLGISINEKIIDKYPFIKGPWSWFKLYSPEETVAVTGDHSIKWIEGKNS
ncbi:MAG: mandelate racemase/muconate lactonizing enzyme family protein [Prolixibacteraceae bacterium]|nr:mandelate racemase/muconate lactonizing enzyme family protein [Prolixibacteraceae bacterium]